MADVIKLLEADHREVESLFAKAESTTGAAKMQVVGKLRAELILHTQIEEDIVYPAMRSAGPQKIVDEAEEEHRTVRELVAQLQDMDVVTREVDQLLHQLKTDVQHHVEEEESEAFPEFRAAVDEDRIGELGDRVEDAKKANGTRDQAKPQDPEARLTGPNAGHDPRALKLAAARIHAEKPATRQPRDPDPEGDHDPAALEDAARKMHVKD